MHDVITETKQLGLTEELLQIELVSICYYVEWLGKTGKLIVFQQQQVIRTARVI